MQGALRWAFVGLFAALALAACGTVLALGDPDENPGGDGGASEGSAADSSPVEGGPDVDGGCSTGRIACGSTCFDPKTSADHCGSCNTKCNRGPCLDGGCEKTVFVTNALYNGNLGGLDGGDTKCNQVAAAAGLLGTYKAWLASETEAPADRFTKNAAGYGLVDGGLVAASWTGLVGGSLLQPISVAEDGGVTTEAVWSNVAPDGGRRAPGQSCMDWTTSAGAPAIGGTGLSAARDGTWTANVQPGCDGTHPIYCFEQ